ncbi:MAG: O-antigen ligase family protein [Bacteroidota bacterium]
MQLQISYNNFLHFLFCAFAFLIPFEHVLEVYFGIETVLKPYRVAALMIIGLFLLRILRTGRFELRKDFRQDFFLYFLFLYGIIITMFQIFLNEFSSKHFYNDSIQYFLYLAVFFVLKNTPLNLAQITRIIWWMFAGIFLNTLYLFNNFYFLQNYERQSGFMDNPNYVAISIVIAITFVVLQLSNVRSLLLRFLLLGLIVFLLLMLVIAGSRTGFAIFVIVGIFLLLFASWGKRLIIFSAMTLLFLVYTGQSDAFDFGAPLILFDRLNKIESTEDTRFHLWRGAYKAVLSSNFAGLGIGQFKTRFREFYLTIHEDTIYENVNRGGHLSAHSDYVAITVTYGLIGLFCYLLFLYRSMIYAFGNVFRTRIGQLGVHHQFCLMTLITLAVFGITSENFNSAIYWMSLAISTKIIS